MELRDRQGFDECLAHLGRDLTDVYRRQVEELVDQVKAPDLKPRAVSLLRDLVERLVLHPLEQRGCFDLEIQGHLAGLARFATGQPARSTIVPKVVLSLAERGGASDALSATY